MEHILILGAKSDMAKAFATEIAKAGNCQLYLAARQKENLHLFANDLEIRYQVKTALYELDIEDIKFHQEFYDKFKGKLTQVISFVGLLGNQEEAEINWESCQKIMMVNYLGIVSFLNIVANDFERRRSGCIIGVSSVAGERGRQSNYFYGSAKAAFTSYLSGLRNRLFKSNVSVITVKPGFVYTKMTEGLDLPKLLTVTPSYVAKTIAKASKNKQNVVYVKWIWRYIMLIIRNIPEFMFKKLNL